MADQQQDEDFDALLDDCAQDLTQKLEIDPPATQGVAE
jgi:hypothetical protein